MTVGTRLYTWLRGELVGRDAYGNRYYREKGGRRRDVGGLDRERRWVIYNGEPEGSRVPPEWHAWLHHTSEAPPLGQRPTRPWIKEHLPNLTGTANAYRPRGHEFRGGRRAKATGDYEPWRPE
jgi:NADH:ubiquinone oxidoreductase subunit